MKPTDQNMVLERYAKGKEASLIEKYILRGPMQLKAELGVSEEEWRAIFDYLVFEHNLLYKCVINATDFFATEYVKHGMAQIREILDTVDDKYNMALAVVFDYLAISREGLFYHVIHNRERYLAALRQRGSEFVRRVLGVYADKYDEHWKKVLDILLKAACEDVFSKRTFDESLDAFGKIFNAGRTQRKIFKSGVIE